MAGGSPAHRKAAITTFLDSLSLQPPATFAIPPTSHHLPDGEPGIAAHLGVCPAGGNAERPSGISDVARFDPAPSRGASDHFDDAPYVPPPRVPHQHPALDPRVHNVFPRPPTHDFHTARIVSRTLSRPPVSLPFPQYPYEGGTSPSESQHSVDSTWSTSSSSSTSSHHLPHDYLVEPTPHYPRHPAYTHHYPAYHGHHRLGLDHIRYAEQPSNAGGSYYRNPHHAYPVDVLLAPEPFDDPSPQVPVQSQQKYPSTSPHGSSSSSPSIPATSQINITTFSVSPTPHTDSARSNFPDAGPYLRQQLGLSPHEPVDLRSIPDPPAGGKPSTPLPTLIKLAIYGSPNKQLTLQEIYAELENRFQWFREHKNQKAWKNSIRHNLSLNKVFRHVPRPITEPGKGSYWQLDVSGGEGYKRPRKRKRRSRMLASEEEDEEDEEMDEDRQSALDPSQQAGSTRSTAAAENTHIDPELRSEGHVVGEGRTRSATRRAGAGSPYPSQSPRYQQGPLPAVAGGQDAVAQSGQPRFGQPSLVPGAFAVYPPARQMPAASSAFSFAADVPSSSSISMAAAATASSSTGARPSQYVASYDRTAPVSVPPPRPGIEYVTGPGGLPTARRVNAYPEPEPPRGNVGRSPTGSLSSSGSSQTWNDARARSQMDDQRLG